MASGGVHLYGAGVEVGAHSRDRVEDNRREWFDHTGLIGQPDCGKSYRAKLILNQRARAVAFDPEWQYGDGPRQNPMPGWAIVHEPGELKDFLRERLGATFRVIYQPKFQAEVHLDHVVRLLAEGVTEVTLGIDEIANYCSPSHLPDGLDYICRCGRHPSVSLVWTSQRPADVARKLTAASQRLMIFRFQDVPELKWARDRGLSDEQIAELQRLDQGYFFGKTRLGNWELFGPDWRE